MASTDHSRGDRRRRSLLPKGLAGLAGLACAACCIIPLLLAAGALGGAAWAGIVRALPITAIALAAAAGLLWWSNSRRKTTGCGPECQCRTG